LLATGPVGETDDFGDRGAPVPLELGAELALALASEPGVGSPLRVRLGDVDDDETEAVGEAEAVPSSDATPAPGEPPRDGPTVGPALPDPNPAGCDAAGVRPACDDDVSHAATPTASAAATERAVTRRRACGRASGKASENRLE